MTVNEFFDGTLIVMIMFLIRLKNNTSLLKPTTILYVFLLLCIIYILLPYSKIFSLEKDTIFSDEALMKMTSFYSPSFNTTDDVSISLYYRQTTSARNSSYPYISGDTFRAFSDYVYDETREDNLNSMKYGDIVFVKTDLLSKFFSSPFKSIQNPFVLITHNSDDFAPSGYAEKLSDPKILHWYTSNPSERNHRKLSPIPIGLSNRRWTEGNLEQIQYAFKTHRKPWSQRTNLLYVNFALSTNRKQRREALAQAETLPNVQIIKARISFETYLEQIGNVKFVLSPPGNGLDCHRTWEALFMGAVPIVLTSKLNLLFSNTRTVIINKWSKLTEPFLLSLNFSNNEHLLPDVFYAHYWRDNLVQYR